MTRDAFLGGRVVVEQPGHGHHRSGLDAVMLAASVPEAQAGSHVVDLGAGVGVAGLCVAARLPQVRVSLAEIDPELAALARANVALNAAIGAPGRIAVIEADITARAAERAAAGLIPGSADHVIANPPFRRAGTGRPSPQPGRASAHMLAPGELDAWMRTAADLAKPGGTATVIWPAADLAALLEAFGGRFGQITLLPLHPAARKPALRVIARGVKGSRGPLVLMPGLILHDASGAYTEAADRILRRGGALELGGRPGS